MKFLIVDLQDGSAQQVTSVTPEHKVGIENGDIDVIHWAELDQHYQTMDANGNWTRVEQA